MNQNLQPQNTGFYGLGITPVFLKTLEKLEFKEPTPIQRQAMPVAIEGKDVVGIAQTGTGKTIAFGIPMLQRLNQTKGRGLVVVPTRELAIQVDDALHQVGLGIGLKTAVLIGGTAIRPQIQALNRNPHIIIATPGRLNDHLEQRTARLSNVNVVVLDEADRMLDMGFEPQIRRIFNVLPHNRQTMLFSATIPHAIMTMATKYMKLPIRIEVAPTGTTVASVTQEIFIVSKDVKPRLAEKLLKQYHGPTLIFTRTKRGASKLTRTLCSIGHRAAEIHSNRSLNQRREALEGFKSGKYRILVATDVASRGIDVIGIELVINYDLPDNSEDYVHRIGRTARAGANGHAISFVTSEQRRDVQRIERLIRKSLPISPLPAGLPP
ncbi:MAG: DEAD/DEAH box helicase, partial [Syntrophaceae bacterium]|nr:DEAD/DEAH box helicase [Syntrophaceae bacterium]